VTAGVAGGLVALAAVLLRFAEPARAGAWLRSVNVHT
jgi:hypothetical protein